MIVTNRWGQRMFNGLVVDVRREKKDVVLHVLTHSRATHYQVRLSKDDLRELRDVCRRVD